MMSLTSLPLHIDPQLKHQNWCFINHNKWQGLHWETLHHYLTLRWLGKQLTVALTYQVVQEHLGKKVNFVIMYVDRKAGHIKPQCPRLKGKQWVARVKIKDLIKEDEEASESLTNRAPNDALDKSTYPQEGEEDLKNNSGDDEGDQP